MSLAFDGALSMERLEQWLGVIMQTKGPDMFRIKGLLNIDGQEDRFVLHAVHMLVEAEPMGPWEPDSPKTNRIVFIGRDLDRAVLEEGLQLCVVA